jgi:DNA recombination protein RmuC
MSDFLFLFIGLIIFFIGILLGFLYSKNKSNQKVSERDRQITQQNAELQQLQQQLSREREDVKKLQEKFETQFENLAQKILDQKSEKFTLQNKKNIEGILDPLQQKIKSFEEKIENNSHNSIQRHTELGEQLKFLREQNIKISEEALNLTKALKGDTKMQGNWGEVILERILEQSGLEEGREYRRQESAKTEEGKRRFLDVVIELPENKKMVIDSKVSLNAYERYVNEPEQAEKEKFLKQHIAAIQARVKELSEKNYHALFPEESPDFVLLFIPIEGAFAVASREQDNLYSKAFEKNIIIVTPTTLLAVLKTIDSMWQNEKQQQNALDIARKAGALHDTFVNLIEEFEKVGNQLGTVQKTYDRSMKKLTGNQNLVKKVNELQKLGAKNDKNIDPKYLRENESLED